MESSPKLNRIEFEANQFQFSDSSRHSSHCIVADANEVHVFQARTSYLSRRLSTYILSDLPTIYGHPTGWPRHTYIVPSECSLT